MRILIKSEKNIIFSDDRSALLQNIPLYQGTEKVYLYRQKTRTQTKNTRAQTKNTHAQTKFTYTETCTDKLYLCKEGTR